MSVSAMNDFRSEIKMASAAKDADFHWIALEAIAMWFSKKGHKVKHL